MPSLKSPLDIRVHCGRWTWSETEDEPPVALVLATNFWSKPDYQLLREGLRRPLPDPQVHQGEQFDTVQTVRVKSVEKKTETPEGAAETTEGAAATPVDPATVAATGVQPPSPSSRLCAGDGDP